MLDGEEKEVRVVPAAIPACSSRARSPTRSLTTQSVCLSYLNCLSKFKVSFCYAYQRKMSFYCMYHELATFAEEKPHQVTYRGTSLMRNSPPLGPYSRVLEGGCFL